MGRPDDDGPTLHDRRTDRCRRCALAIGHRRLVRSLRSVHRAVHAVRSCRYRDAATAAADHVFVLRRVHLPQADQRRRDARPTAVRPGRAAGPSGLDGLQLRTWFPDWRRSGGEPSLQHRRVVYLLRKRRLQQPWTADRQRRRRRGRLVSALAQLGHPRRRRWRRRPQRTRLPTRRSRVPDPPATRSAILDQRRRGSALTVNWSNRSPKPATSTSSAKSTRTPRSTSTAAE
jgi:hypothetical protein